MFKLSKLLYAIVNEISPVPQEILNWALNCYEDFIKSNENVKVYNEKIKSFNLKQYFGQELRNKLNQNKIQLVFIKDIKNDGGFGLYNDYRIDIYCVQLNQDKDVLEHELKHYFQYWIAKYTKANMQQLHEFYNLQFETYVTDFCNLVTQIYKRLNRRFNVSLDTIIQKVIVDVVDNKTNINKYRKLLNGSSEFDCYIKTLTILQLYKYGCSVINQHFQKYIETKCNIKLFKNKEKYEQFFEILKRHLKSNVKKLSQYNIKDAINKKDFYIIDQMVQKRVIKKKDINDIIEFLIQNNQQKILSNLIVCYNLNKDQYNIAFNSLDRYCQQKVLKQKHEL